MVLISTVLSLCADYSRIKEYMSLTHLNQPNSTQMKLTPTLNVLKMENGMQVQE